MGTGEIGRLKTGVCEIKCQDKEGTSFFPKLFAIILIYVHSVCQQPRRYKRPLLPNNSWEHSRYCLANTVLVHHIVFVQIISIKGRPERDIVHEFLDRSMLCSLLYMYIQSKLGFSMDDTVLCSLFKHLASLNVYF